VGEDTPGLFLCINKELINASPLAYFGMKLLILFRFNQLKEAGFGPAWRRYIRLGNKVI